MGGEPGDLIRAPVALGPSLAHNPERGGNEPASPLRPRRPYGRGFWESKRKVWGALVVVGMLVVSFIAAIAYYWVQKSRADEDYVEVYVTDLPADFARLDVTLDGVYVGGQEYPLELRQGRFDILALQGPEDALLVAAGNVPDGDHREIRLVFRSVRGLLNGEYLPIGIPDGVLRVEHDYGLDTSRSRAFLFDLDLEKSLQMTESGLVFRPTVGALYIHDYDTDRQTSVLSPGAGNASAPPGAAPRFASGEPPAKQDLSQGSPSGRAKQPFQWTTPTSSPESRKFNWNPPPEEYRAPGSNESGGGQNTTSPGPTDALGSYLPETGGAAGNGSGLPPTDLLGATPQPLPPPTLGWFVQYVPDSASGSSAPAFLAIESAGGEILYTFGSVPAAYVLATVAEAEAISKLPQIQYVENDRPVVLNLASSKAAMRLPELLNPATGLRDPSGNLLDGRGIAVAVIDVGVDGTHPDLPHWTLNPANPLLVGNIKVESLFTVDLPTTDQTSGHGTHVTSILAGRGVTDPTLAGVAPGVRVWSLAIGEVQTTLWPNQALDWVVQNHNQVNPPIKVVTNSWGSGSSYDPNSVTTRLVNQLVAAGVTVVFAAGNSGGDGSFATTTSQCQIPTAGVICVAAYDDRGQGTRDGGIASYSSRGRIANPASWPDLSAPGHRILAARPIAGAVTGVGLLNAYVELDGTSMAAPHVAGAVALVLQARPGLSPAQVEAILENTAYKYADGGAYGASGHHAKGAGLVDVYTAVQAAKST